MASAAESNTQPSMPKLVPVVALAFASPSPSNEGEEGEEEEVVASNPRTG